MGLYKWVDLGIAYNKVNFVPLGFYMGKSWKKSFEVYEPKSLNLEH